MKKSKKILVIKYGGSLMDNNKSNEKIIKNIKKLSGKNSVIVVHGGGRAISKAMENAGIKPRFVKGLRYTDAKSVKIVRRVLEGLQKKIVKKLKSSIAITGISYGKRIKKLGYVGKFEKADTGAILSALKDDKICVLNCLGRNKKGVWLNMNADDVASGIACSLKADKLIFFTNVSGVLDKTGRTISTINKRSIEKLIKEGAVSGGMIPKLQGCRKAISKGVKEINILSTDLKGTKIL